MKKIHKNKLILTLAAVLVPAMVLISVNSAHAVTPAPEVSKTDASTSEDANINTIINKIKLTNVYKCYYRSNKAGVKTKIDANDYTDAKKASNLILKSKDQYQPALPQGIVKHTESYKYNCEQALNEGYSLAKNVYGQKNPKNIPPSASKKKQVKEFLIGMGYDAPKEDTSNKNKQTTTTFKYTQKPKVAQEPEATTVKISAEVNDEGIITSKVKASWTGLWNRRDIELKDYPDDKGDGKNDRKLGYCFVSCQQKKFIRYTIGKTKWEDVRNKVLTALAKKSPLRDTETKMVNNILTTKEVEYTLNKTAIDDETPITDGTIYKLKDKSAKTAGREAIKFLSNGTYSSSSMLALDTAEKIILLQTYLEDYYKINIEACNPSKDQKTILKAQKEFSPVRLYHEGKFETCYVKPTKNAKKEVYSYGSTGIWGKNKLSYNQILKALNSKEFKEVTKLSNTAFKLDSYNKSEEEKSDDTSQTTLCFSASGSLGWILCPVIQAVGDLTDYMYNWISTSFLEVNASIFNNDKNKTTYEGWKAFRDFANILFVVLLMVVIISQLTGVGISNYGIKKVLPRLIMTIILINLSFIICQLAIDVSNIVADGIRTLFDGLTSRIDPQVVEFNVGTFIRGLITSLFEIGGTGIGVYALVNNWSAVLPFVLLTLISCAIGVLFFFILLAVRQAAVILLVVISPIAIVCYALPGTKNIANRWFKMLTAALLVYPICALMMSGGEFAGMLLRVAGGEADEKGFFFQLIAALINVVPFFLIPSVLKSSFSAMGSLGTKISGLGARLSRSATGATRNSEAYKDWRTQQLSTNAANAARRYKEGRGLRHGASKALRRMGANGVADRLDAAHARSAAMSYQRYTKNEMDNLAAGLAAENMDETSLEGKKATMRDEFEQSQIKDAANLIRQDKGIYTDDDGKVHKINVNDTGSLATAQRHFIDKANNATDGKERQRYMRQALATQQLLFEKGDPGRTQAMKNLYKNVVGDSENGIEGQGKSAATVALASQIQRDPKAMATLKNEDPGSLRLVNALTSNEEITPEKIKEFMPKASDFPVDKAATMSDNTVDMISDHLNEMDNPEVLAFSDLFEQAFSDSRLYSQIKPKNTYMNMVNNVRKKAYNIRAEEWMQKNGGSREDYEKLHGKFEKIVRPGDDFLKVPRDRGGQTSSPQSAPPEAGFGGIEGWKN